MAGIWDDMEGGLRSIGVSVIESVFGAVMPGVAVGDGFEKEMVHKICRSGGRVQGTEISIQGCGDQKGKVLTGSARRRSEYPFHKWHSSEHAAHSSFRCFNARKEQF